MPRRPPDEGSPLYGSCRVESRNEVHRSKPHVRGLQNIVSQLGELAVTLFSFTHESSHDVVRLAKRDPLANQEVRQIRRAQVAVLESGSQTITSKSSGLDGAGKRI